MDTSNTKAQALNTKLQKDGKDLLEKSNIINLLKEFGDVTIGGSYVYGTMVDEDIDVDVIVKNGEITFTLRDQVMNALLKIDGLDGIAMSDRFHFPSKYYGIWFGPKVWHDNKKWNINIWIVYGDEPNTYQNNELHQKMLKITEAQRSTMLNIKYQALRAGTKDKGITSSLIYNAVIDKGVSTYADFIKLQA